MEPPAMPEPTPQPLLADDGAPVRAWRWCDPQPDAACVVAVHGLGDHARALPSARLARALAAHGCGVWTFDLRGHGEVPARTRGIAGWPELVADLRAVVAAAHAASARPVVVAGISLGALLALECLAEPPAALAGVAAVAAPLGPVRASALAQAAARGLGRWLPRLPLQTGIDLAQVADDAAAVRAWREDPRVHTRVGAGLAAAALAAPRRLRAALASTRVPVLLQHGLADAVAPWDPGIAAALPGARCTVRTYAAGRHNLFLDRCAAQVFADLAAWAGAQAAAAR